MIAQLGSGNGFTPIFEYENMGGGGGGSTVLFNTIEHVQTAAFTSIDITLPVTGSGVLSAAIWVDYQQGYAMRNRDWQYIGPNTVRILFEDDPANYVEGQLVFQITYAYNA